MNTDKSEQWLLDGQCGICRKKNYCSKPCRACKDRREFEVRRMIASAMYQVIGGQDGKIN